MVDISSDAVIQSFLSMNNKVIILDDETGQDVRNNCSENSSVKGDAQVEYSN